MTFSLSSFAPVSTVLLTFKILHIGFGSHCQDTAETFDVVCCCTELSNLTLHYRHCQLDVADVCLAVSNVQDEASGPAQGLKDLSDRCSGHLLSARFG